MNTLRKDHRPRSIFVFKDKSIEKRPLALVSQKVFPNKSLIDIYKQKVYYHDFQKKNKSLCGC